MPHFPIENNKPKTLVVAEKKNINAVIEVPALIKYTPEQMSTYTGLTIDRKCTKDESEAVLRPLGLLDIKATGSKWRCAGADGQQYKYYQCKFGDRSYKKGQVFLDCHAWVYIGMGKMITIRGCLQHSKSCNKAYPPNHRTILHDSVSDAILNKIRNGILVHRILLELNADITPGMEIRDGFRYVVRPYDIYNRMGVSISIDESLSILANHDACRYFLPLTSENRYEMIIMTEDQLVAACKYAHNGMIFFDGTFGVTKNHLLMFTVMSMFFPCLCFTF